MAAPDNLKYTDTHEWVKIDGNIATIGITDFAQKQLGDIVFVEVPTVGKKINAGDAAGTIESVKAASELYAPIAGTVTEANTELNDAPEDINTEPYESWIFKISFDNGADLSLLLDKEPTDD